MQQINLIIPLLLILSRMYSFPIHLLSKNFVKKHKTAIHSFSTLMNIPVPIRGLHEIIDQYDVFLLDQFGVLHDGVKTLTGVNDALNYLHSKNKTTIILSNTSSRAKHAKKRYAQLGLPAYYTDFVTSGEISSYYLQQHYQGKKCTWLTWSSYAKDKTLAEHQIEVADIRNADFLFLHGTQVIVNSQYDEELNKKTSFFMDGDVNHPLIEEIISIGIERKIPAICANMDLTAIAFGQTAYMLGKIMLEYQRRGGEVISFGKPMKEFFDHAIQRLGSSTLENRKLRRRIIHVGDSIHHDIAGAHAAGIDSLLITEHGVHNKELHQKDDDALSQEKKLQAILTRVVTICDEENVPRPSYFLGSFAK